MLNDERILLPTYLRIYLPTDLPTYLPNLVAHRITSELPLNIDECQPITKDCEKGRWRVMPTPIDKLRGE